MKDLILNIVFSLWTKSLWFRPKFCENDFNTAFNMSRWTTSRETSASWIELSKFNSVLGLWGCRTSIFSETKTVRTAKTAYNVCGDTVRGKNVFFSENLQLYTFVRTLMETHSEVRPKTLLWFLETGVYVSKRNSNEVNFFGTIDFHLFFPHFEQKISSRFVKTFFHVSRSIFEEWGFISNGFNSWKFFRNSNKKIRVQVETFQQDFQYCILRVQRKKLKKSFLCESFCL